MLEIQIPNDRVLRLHHLVLDYNGTLAYDGRLLKGVASRLAALAQQLTVHVVTADTFGHAHAELAGTPCSLSIVPASGQDHSKLAYIQELGCTETVCIGNGRNDRLMLKAAALGIAVLQEEGAAVESLLAADLVAPSILAALDLLLHPLRLAATLRT